VIFFERVPAASLPTTGTEAAMPWDDVISPSLSVAERLGDELVDAKFFWITEDW